MIFFSEKRKVYCSSLHLAVAVAFISISFSLGLAQGAIDYTGTGGRHTIQGRIYFPSGRISDAPGLKIKLESMANGDLSLITDPNGSFSFKNLVAGSYTIVIEGTNDYEAVREPVYIDDPGSSSMRSASIVGSTPRIFNFPIYLIPKRTKSVKPGVLSAALADVPKAAADLYTSALQASATDDRKKAIEDLKAAILIYPKFPLALNELGVQYLKLGQADKALDPLSAAIKLVPDDLQARLNYGIALQERREFSEAEKQLREVLKRNESLPTAHMYLGITLVALKNLAEAQKELERAISLRGGEGLAQAHRYLGGIYWGNKDYKRAADQLETYLKLAPKAADAERTRSAIKDLRSRPAG